MDGESRESIQSETSEFEAVADATALTFKQKKCRYCRAIWEPHRPASHLPGCPNVPKEK